MSAGFVQYVYKVSLTRSRKKIIFYAVCLFSQYHPSIDNVSLLQNQVARSKQAEQPQPKQPPTTNHYHPEPPITPDPPKPSQRSPSPSPSPLPHREQPSSPFLSSRKTEPAPPTQTRRYPKPSPPTRATCFSGRLRVVSELPRSASPRPLPILRIQRVRFCILDRCIHFLLEGEVGVECASKRRMCLRRQKRLVQLIRLSLSTLPHAACPPKLLP